MKRKLLDGAQYRWQTTRATGTFPLSKILGSATAAGVYTLVATCLGKFKLGVTLIRQTTCLAVNKAGRGAKKNKRIKCRVQDYKNGSKFAPGVWDKDLIFKFCTEDRKSKRYILNLDTNFLIAYF